MLYTKKICLVLMPSISLLIANIKGSLSEASNDTFIETNFDIHQMSWNELIEIQRNSSEDVQQFPWQQTTNNSNSEGELEQIMWLATHIGEGRQLKKRTWLGSNQEQQTISWPDNASKDGDTEQITWGRPNTDTAHFDYDNPDNVTVMVGQRALLPCSVINLDKKDVSWIRQRDLHILTVGIFTYTTDDRFKVFHPENSNQWSLEINPVTFRDEGTYECQVSTSPKIFLPILLTVELQQAKISGPSEVFIQNSSTIRLICSINTHSDNVGAVRWYRNTTRMDYDSPRGGVSIEIEKTPVRTTSKLFLTRAGRNDSGNYTCAPEFADAASVMVHVVNGEESAAVHTADSVTIEANLTLLLSCLFILLSLQVEPR